MIIEDSPHTYEKALDILEQYSALLSKGDGFIVENGICHHGLDIGPDPGPYEAVEQFVQHNDRFKIDRSKESFLTTWNPKRFLICE